MFIFLYIYNFLIGWFCWIELSILITFTMRKQHNYNTYKQNRDEYKNNNNNNNDNFDDENNVTDVNLCSNILYNINNLMYLLFVFLCYVMSLLITIGLIFLVIIIFIK